MKKAFNHIKWGFILFPFFISMFSINYFPSWLLFGLYILLLGILGTFGSFSSKLNAVEKQAKRIRMRIALFITGIGMLAFFYFVFASSYLDIGNYFNQNYKTVKGFPTQIEHLSARNNLYQYISVGNMTLKSSYEIPEEDFDKEIKAVYLPRSKYVLKLWIYR